MQVGTHRRTVLASGFGVVSGLGALGFAGGTLAVPKKTLRFPRDHNVHPSFGREAWQLAGYATAGLQDIGFQVSFYRESAGGSQGWHAHASLTDVSGGRFLHDQRVNGIGAQATLDVAGWSLNVGARKIDATVKSDAFGWALTLKPRRSILLHGEDGEVRRGVGAEQVSYQYSLPQCTVQGDIFLNGRMLAIQGNAWLTHEWSHDFSAHQAAGWDSFTMNLFDGSFVHAFQVRNKKGERLWDGGVLLTGKGQRFEFRRGTVEFSRQKSWKSLLTRANYPVEWIVRTPADFYTVRAALPHQEFDGRPASGGVYWKGISDLFDSNGKHIGRGYLEMTGYAQTKSL